MSLSRADFEKPTVLLFSATCPASSFFHNEYIDPKWSMTLIVALTLLVWHLSCKRTNIVMSNIMTAVLPVSIYLCIYTYLHCMLLKSHSLTGPFENPNVLALHLSLLLPLVHHESVVKKENGTLWALSIAAELLCIITIVLTECRTACICLLFFYSYTLLKGKWKFVVIPLLLSVGLLSALFVKRPSSQGRIFILQNTMKLISQAPVLGHGVHGFDRTYMPQQAEYFRTHDNAEAEMLADDIHHPLNEFLLVGVNHGIVGIVILATVLALPLAWRKKLYVCYRPLWMSLCMLIVFCMFGYPLLYPLPWLLIIGCWILVFKKTFILYLISFRVAVITLITGLLLGVFAYTACLIRWGFAAKKNNNKVYSNELLKEYKSLYPILSWRSTYLYDYAYHSFLFGRMMEADRILDMLKKKCNSYNIQLLHADVQFYLNNYHEALFYYQEAHYMCPCRFAPLEGMMKIYKQEMNTDAIESLKKYVNRKEIKVKSKETIEIINQINKLSL